MYTYEHSLDTAAPAHAIFALYTDITTWPTWDEAVEHMTLDGPFAARTSGTMTIRGRGPLPVMITAVEPGRGFSDATTLPGAGLVVSFQHTLTPLENGGTRITHAVTITGPAAESLGEKIGPQITAGVPETMATLAKRALELQRA